MDSLERDKYPLIYSLSEGTFSVDKDKQFKPFDRGKDDLLARSQGSLLVEVQPFCVKTSKGYYLLDAGLGFRGLSGGFQILENLAAHGIEREMIRGVLMSHLHGDHVGGLAYRNASGVMVPMFPDATHYIFRNEYDYALSGDSHSYRWDHFRIFPEIAKVQFLETSEGLIDDLIEYRLVGGHCPFHLAFWIRENGKTVFYGGDTAPQLRQMKIRFIAKYDYDGKRSNELRHEWWLQGIEENWAFLFYHDLKCPVFSNQPF